MTRWCDVAAALLFAFVVLLSPLAGHAASFDCTKAASQVEKMICAEDEISRLDDELAAAYRAASGAAGAADQVRRDQRQWLAVRNACRDRTCIKSAYDRRLVDLRVARGLSQAGKPAAAPVTDAKPSVQAPAISSAPEEQQGSGVREIRSTEFKRFDGRVRIDAGRAVFSHYDQSGNSQNIVAMNIGDGSARNLVEGVRGGRFVAEDARYLVYSSKGANANPLVVVDKRANKRVATVRLRHEISWGHIAGDRLLIAQSGMSHNSKATILVYRLPGLKLERSAEITGGNDTALWGDKIVSIGYRLGIYDLDLREISVVDMPIPDPNLRSNCGGGPLRISGDKAVVGANCAQLAVVDLPSARIERIIPTASFFQKFTIAEGLLFTVDAGGEAPDVGVIELSSGRELARIGIDASFLAMQGKSLLAKKSKDATRVRFTLYEVDFASIRSETSRIARTLGGCRAAQQTPDRQSDLHAALEACEKAGISGYVEETTLLPELREALDKYARWLTLSLSRYAEGVAILERLQRSKPESGIESQIAMANRKAFYLDLPPKEARLSQAPAPKGITRVPIDFGAFLEMMQFEGERLYIARWDCDSSGHPGVTLDVLDRKTFRAIKRVVVADCDDTQQDSITAISVVPGYIVLGLGYQSEEDAGRPTVAVVNARTLEVVKKGFVNQEIAGLNQWKGRLLACAPGSDEPHHRFDPASGHFVAATEDEARACANGDPVPLTGRGVPEAETPHYRAFAVRTRPLSTYRFTHKGTGVTRAVKLAERQYAQALAVPDRDALVLRYESGQRTRFAYFDIEAQTEVVMFELNPLTRPVAAVVWTHYLFVTLGRDLLVYDLDRRMVVGYEKELIREGFLDSCCGMDRNRIVRLVLDEGRLLVLTFDGSNSRVIDLPAYTAGLPVRDFFLAPE